MSGRTSLRAASLGFLAGVLALGSFRTLAVPPAEGVHHHANMAVFLEGERVDLSGDRYMEDVAACYGGGGMGPRERVHLHLNDPDVVHVHDSGVTWGHFFQNLGWTLGRDHLVTDTGRRFFHGEGGSLTFILNGLAVGEVHDRVIASGDRLLVDFGSDPPEVVRDLRYPQVASTAEEHNHLPDPATCSGAGAADDGLPGRLRRGFWR